MQMSEHPHATQTVWIQFQWHVSQCRGSDKAVQFSFTWKIKRQQHESFSFHVKCALKTALSLGHFAGFLCQTWVELVFLLTVIQHGSVGLLDLDLVKSHSSVPMQIVVKKCAITRLQKNKCVIRIADSFHILWLFSSSVSILQPKTH